MVWAKEGAERRFALGPPGQLCLRRDSLASPLSSPPCYSLGLDPLDLRSSAHLRTSPLRGNRCRPLSKSGQKCEWKKNKMKDKLILLPLQDYVADILSRQVAKWSSPCTQQSGGCACYFQLMKGRGVCIVHLARTGGKDVCEKSLRWRG